MLRALMSLEKMTYDAQTGTVIYRSKMHLGLKRNFQVMPGAEWLELLCRHIPDRYEHLVRYVGLYSNRTRGERGKALKVQQAAKTPTAAIVPVSEFAARTKAAWARLTARMPQVQGADAGHRTDRRSGRRAANPRAPGTVGARARRARPAGRSAALACEQRHSFHLSPSA
jgi:hypothetical protein